MVNKTVFVFFLFTIAVYARNIENLRDHYLTQPKLDFGQHNDGSHYEVQQNRREISLRNDNINAFDYRRAPDMNSQDYNQNGNVPDINRFSEHRRLDTESNRRVGNLHSNVHRSFEYVSSGEDFHGVAINRQSNLKKNRRTPWIAHVDHNSQGFDRNTNIQSNKENKFRVNLQDTAQNGPPVYIIEKSHGYEISPNHRHTDNTFHHTDNTFHHTDNTFHHTDNAFYSNTRPNHEAHNVDRIDSRLNTDSHTQGGLQNHRDINQFESVSLEERKIIDTHNNNHASNEDKSDISYGINVNTDSKDRLGAKEIQNTKKFELEKTSDESKNSDSGEAQRPIWKTTTDNEVVNNKSKDINKYPELEDKWVWSEETTTVLVIPDSVDNRNVFNGDKCPTGKVKIGDVCVDPD